MAASLGPEHDVPPGELVHPVTGTNLPDTIRRTRAGQIRALAELKPELPQEICELVMALLRSLAFFVVCFNLSPRSILFSNRA